MSGYWEVLVAGAFDRSPAHCERHDSPPDRATLRQAARELRSRGLTLTDIGDALRISTGAVRELLEDSPE